MTNDGTASAWEPGGLMARGLHTRGIDTPSGWPRAQRRPGRRGRPATACAHALPTATPSPRAVRGWGRARARCAGKAGCPGLPLATGRPAPACCRPGHGGHVASGWRAVTPELPAWLLEHSIRLLWPPGGGRQGLGLFLPRSAAPGRLAPRWPCGWRTPDRLISVATGGTHLGPGALVLPQVPDGGSSAASVPWCVHSTRRWAPTARSAEARAGTSPREQVPRRARPESV